MINLGTRKVIVDRGDCIAQMIVIPYSIFHLVECELSRTTRNLKSFGSSGPKADGKSVQTEARATEVAIDKSLKELDKALKSLKESNEEMELGQFDFSDILEMCMTE